VTQHRLEAAVAAGLSGPVIPRPDYQDHGVLFCCEDGRPPHPDPITRRFEKLAATAGLHEIDLDDVRHS
jgi:hypothetical protein